MLRNITYALCATVCLVLKSGCSSEAMSPIEAPEVLSQDSAFAFLERVDERALRNAFESLGVSTYTRAIRTEQLDREGTPIAYVERTIHHTPSRTRVVASDSFGEFDFGYLDRFVSRSDRLRSPPGPAQYAIPDDPAYLSRRNRESYRYDVRSGTAANGEPVSVVEIALREELGQEQPIRRARLFVAPGTRELMAIYIERVHAALWFREESALYLSVRRHGSGAWVPDSTRFESLLRVPLRPSQRFRTVSTFRAYDGPIR